MTRRILIIAYHFPPDAAVGALRPLKFAKYLPEFGWEPWVLTVRSEYYESLDRSRLNEVACGSRVFPTRMLPHPSTLYKSAKSSYYTATGRRQEFSRKLVEPDAHPDSHGRLGKIRKFLGALLWIPPDDVLGWLPIAALKGIRLVKAHRITHIYTTNPPHTTHLVGLAIKNLCDVKWVADFRDLWLFDKPFQTRTADRIERWMERKVVEKADAVTLTTDRMADKFRATYPTVDPKKFATIWNGYDGEDFQSIRPAGDREKFTLTYLGSFYDERTPEPLLAAVSELVTAGEIPDDALEIELIGNCRYVKGLATDEIAASLGLGSVVKVIDPVPYKRALEYAVSSHLLVLLAPDQPYEIPGKAYEYLASGVGILALTQDGATADLIRKTGGGVVVDPKDIGGIKRAVFDRYMTWVAHRSSSPRRPPAQARKYERRELTKRLVSILEPADVNGSAMMQATSPAPPRRPGVSPGRLRRVLYAIGLNPSLKYGSLEEQVFSLARAFQEQGSLFLPLFQSAPGSEALAMYHRAGLDVSWLDLDTFDFATLGRLMRIIREHRIELVHWNIYRPVNLYLCALSVVAPALRHYLTDHITRELPMELPPGGLRRLVKRLLLRRYGKVVCISGFVRRRLEAEGVWPNLTTCTHFINTDRFRPDDIARPALRKEFGFGGEFVVLVVAQLVDWKGVDVVLRALTRLPSRIVAWIVGDGPDATRLRDLCRSLGLEARVRFFGYQADVSRFMQAADCLVCPTVWAEAAGLVVLEGLACQLPVIGSAVGGIPEFVEERRTGLLFPPGNDAQLAERIQRLESDRETCRWMGLEGRSVMVERFSAKKRVSEYLDLYRVPPRGGDDGQYPAD